MTKLYKNSNNQILETLMTINEQYYVAPFTVSVAIQI